MQSELAAGELVLGHPVEAATAKRFNTLAQEHNRLYGLANIELQDLLKKPVPRRREGQFSSSFLSLGS